jgi:RNA:NAD 2'-phosphotransferase (TPT1/KptA family)
VDAKKAIKEGIVIQRAGKTVYVTDVIPPGYIKKM